MSKGMVVTTPAPTRRILTGVVSCRNAPVPLAPDFRNQQEAEDADREEEGENQPEPGF